MSDIKVFCRTIRIGYRAGVTANGRANFLQCDLLKDTNPLKGIDVADVDWMLSKEGVTPSDAYETLIKDCPAANKRIQVLVEDWADIEGVMIIHEGAGTLYIAPKNRPEAMAFLLTQCGLRNGLIFDFNAHYPAGTGPTSESKKAWLAGRKPLYLQDLRITPWPLSHPDPASAIKMQHNSRAIERL